MDQDQDNNHVCKFCNKTFSNGKILGGHMRMHVAENSVKEDVKLEMLNTGLEGYGLRENPKKSWRFSGSNNNGKDPAQENTKCKLCGKDFESLKSLHGHMRHHSKGERRRIHCQECGKRFPSKRSLTGHMRLHSEKLRVLSESKANSSRPDLVFIALTDTQNLNPVRRKRSNRLRYKTTPNSSSSFSGLNECVFSGFEIDQEVEEVAMSLLMLSEGVYERRRGYNSVCECLDDHSLSCETKSMDQIKESEGVDGFLDGNEFVKLKKPRLEMLDSYAPECKKSKCRYSDRKMVFLEEKKVELELFSTDFDSQKPELGAESRFPRCDIEIEKGSHDESKWNLSEAEGSSQDLMEEIELNLTGLGLKNPITSNCNPDTAYDCLKRSKFKCRACNKTFPSYQALGGHQTSHRTTKSSISYKAEKSQDDALLTKLSRETEEAAATKLEFTENSAGLLEMDGVIGSGDESRKCKEHRCNVCFKIFVSGKALGGHKRAHWHKSKEEVHMVVKGEVSSIRDVFDIDVPDMVDVAEANSDVGLRNNNSCWSETASAIMSHCFV